MHEPRAVAEVVDGDLVVARCPLAPPSLQLLDSLARLELAVRRIGCRLRVSDPDGRVAVLVRLAGLEQVIELSARCTAEARTPRTASGRGSGAAPTPGHPTPR